MLRAAIRGAGYNPKQAVIKGIDIELGQEEPLIIAGPSGSGKTTLFLSITGVLTNLLGGWIEGEVKLWEIDPNTQNGFLKVPELVGVVLQDPEKQISMPTPLDEVSFTLENLGVERAENIALDMLERFRLSGKALHPIENLSGGEKRKVTLAAAIAHNPRILLLDEPTASLDPWSVKSVREFVRNSLNDGRIIVIIEHKVRYFLDLASRIVVLHRGRAVKQLDAHKIGNEEIKMLEALGVDARPDYVDRGSNFKKRFGLCGKKVIHAKDLEAGYPGSTVLRLDEFYACKGEVVAIVGPNGSGKTTLLKTLAGLVKPAGGEIRLWGRRRPFYVPQTPDYMFVHHKVSREIKEIENLAGESHMAKLAYSMLANTRWIQNVLDMPPYKLSHGQRRWLGILIALAYSQGGILLDEPTTGLDMSSYHLLYQVVSNLSEATAVVVATHDVRLVRDLADRVYMVIDGRLVEVEKEKAIEVMEMAWR